jgi:hypothetical protein
MNTLQYFSEALLWYLGQFPHGILKPWLLPPHNPRHLGHVQKMKWRCFAQINAVIDLLSMMLLKILLQALTI